MATAQPRPVSAHPEAQRLIVRELTAFLRATRVRHVHFAEASLPPPVLAYVTHFPRVSVTLEGCHSMEIASAGRLQAVRPVRGHAVFVPENAWNKPDWATPVKVLTLLFGANHIGMSLVHQRGRSSVPTALKASVPGAYDALTHGILTGLVACAADDTERPLTRLLLESLLYSCLKLLKTPLRRPARKALHTYESICQYVQENVQSQVTRESVAKHFALAPSHVSRLFRRQGMMRFNDYVNLARVTRAKFMLRSYNLTVKEIAAQCGYRDTAYFCRIFKTVCKVTPSQFRTREVARAKRAAGG